MPKKSNIILEFLILLLFVTYIFTSCGGNGMRPEKALNNFSKLIEKGNFDDLSLTIYYISPSILTRQPLSVDDLLKMSDVKKIVVNGNSLKEHIDLLNQINNDILIPVKNESRVNARIYYVFETKKGGEIFNVSMWGKDNSIFVNNLEIKENSALYSIIIPYLPEDVAKEFKTYTNK